MKSLIILIATLFTLPAFASAEDVVTESTARVSMHSLQCVINAGYSETPRENRTYTRLTSPPIFIRDPDQLNMELEHHDFHSKGCDIDLIDRLFTESIQRFGFHEVPIKVTKKISTSVIDPEGRCRTHLREAVELNLTEDLILMSVNYRNIDTDCQLPMSSDSL